VVAKVEEQKSDIDAKPEIIPEDIENDKGEEEIEYDGDQIKPILKPEVEIKESDDEKPKAPKTPWKDEKKDDTPLLGPIIIRKPPFITNKPK
jgi:hypothetical protein